MTSRKESNAAYHARRSRWGLFTFRGDELTPAAIDALLELELSQSLRDRLVALKEELTGC